MKLKYFLRGLGTGIILTALILCISYRSGKSSEKSVVDQAKELGMIFPEKTGKPEATELPESSEPPASSETQKPESKDEVTSSGAGVTGTEETTSTTPPGKSAEREATEKPKQTDSTATPEPSDEPSVASRNGDTITFTVRSGLLSSTVAREMKEAGVIQNDKKFDDYLEKNGYSKKVYAGTYQIPKGASYHDIARIITRQD